MCRLLQPSNAYESLQSSIPRAVISIWWPAHSRDGRDSRHSTAPLRTVLLLARPADHTHQIGHSGNSMLPWTDMAPEGTADGAPISAFFSEQHGNTVTAPATVSPLYWLQNDVDRSKDFVLPCFEGSREGTAKKAATTRTARARLFFRWGSDGRDWQ